VRNFVTACKEIVVSVGGDDRKKLVKWAIEKGGLREGKNYSEEENYFDLNITPLIGSNNYVVSTTGKDPDEKSRDEYRPIIRMMDSTSGRMIRNENRRDQSSVICGQVGYMIKNGLTRAFSLDNGNYFVSELVGKRRMGTGCDVILSSWDVGGRRWPSDDRPRIYGKLLRKIDEDTFMATCGADRSVSTLLILNKTMDTKTKIEVHIPFIDLSSYDKPNYEIMTKAVPQIKGLVEKHGKKWYSGLIHTAIFRWEYKNESRNGDTKDSTRERNIVLEDVPLILPVAVRHISRDSAFPRIMPRESWLLFSSNDLYSGEKKEYVLVEMDIIIVTLSCGIICRKVPATLSFAICRDYDNDEDKLIEYCLDIDVILSEEGYAIERRVQNNIEEVPEEMEWTTTCISFEGVVTDCEEFVSVKEKSGHKQKTNAYIIPNGDETVQLEDGILVKTRGQLIKYAYRQ